MMNKKEEKQKKNKNKKLVKTFKRKIFGSVFDE